MDLRGNNNNKKKNLSQPSLVVVVCQLSFFVLCAGCLDTLAAMQELKMGVASAEEETQAVMKVYSKEDYSVVNRFESESIQNHIYFMTL